MADIYPDSEFRDDLDSMLAQLETCERTLQAIRNHLTVLDGAGEISTDRARNNDFRLYLKEKATALERSAHNLLSDINLIASRRWAADHREEVTAHG